METQEEKLGFVKARKRASGSGRFSSFRTLSTHTNGSGIADWNVRIRSKRVLCESSVESDFFQFQIFTIRTTFQGQLVASNVAQELKVRETDRVEWRSVCGRREIAFELRAIVRRSEPIQPAKSRSLLAAGSSTEVPTKRQ